MVVLLHDLSEEMGRILFKNRGGDVAVYASDSAVHQCIGCEDCGVRVPGKCVFEDSGNSFAGDLLNCEELVVVSAMTYGSVSPFIKTMLDRARPLLEPSLELKNGKVSYKTMVKNPFRLRVVFYGPRNPAYEATAVKFLKQIQSEWNVSELVIRFTEDPSLVGGVL